MKTTYKDGFIQSEIDMLLKEHGGDRHKFYTMLNGIPCTERDGQIVIHKDDAFLALKASLGDKIHPIKWD